MNPGSLCAHPVLDDQKRARLCAEPAVAERWVPTGQPEGRGDDRVLMTFCAQHAAEHDAQHPEPLGPPKPGPDGYAGDVDLFFYVDAPKRGGAR